MIDISPAIEWRGRLLDGIGDSHTVMITRQTDGTVTSWSERTHSNECKEICDLLLLHLDSIITDTTGRGQTT
jgi:hypothetical protein